FRRSIVGREGWQRRSWEARSAPQQLPERQRSLAAQKGIVQAVACAAADTSLNASLVLTVERVEEQWQDRRRVQIPLSRRMRTVSTGPSAAYVFGRTRPYGHKGRGVGARRVTARAVPLVAPSIRDPGSARASRLGA